MLLDILAYKTVKVQLLHEICRHEGILEMEEQLAENEASKLAGLLLIEGILLERNNLTNYLSSEKFLLKPLHNLINIS